METEPKLTRVRELLKARGWPLSAELLPQMLKESGGHVVHHFSGGKDSLAAWIAMRRAGFKITPIHFYAVPNISFVDEYLGYLEEHFKTTIVRLPWPDIYMNPAKGGMQYLSSVWRWRDLGLPEELTQHDVRKWWLASMGMDTEMWHTTGFKLTDSFVRRRDMLNVGPIRRETRRVDIVWDYSKDDVLKLIKDEGVRVAPEYAWFNRSFEGIAPHAISYIHEHFPEDYERIKAFYPLLDALIARREHVATAHEKRTSWANTPTIDEDEEGRE